MTPRWYMAKPPNGSSHRLRDVFFNSIFCRWRLFHVEACRYDRFDLLWFCLLCLQRLRLRELHLWLPLFGDHGCSSTGDAYCADDGAGLGRSDIPHLLVSTRAGLYALV